MFNESKKRFKMYKSGKFWVSAPILFFGVALGSTSVVKTDQVQTTSLKTPTVQSIKNNQASSVSSQKQTVILSSKKATTSTSVKSDAQSASFSSSVKKIT